MVECNKEGLYILLHDSITILFEERDYIIYEEQENKNHIKKETYISHITYNDDYHNISNRILLCNKQKFNNKLCKSDFTGEDYRKF